MEATSVTKAMIRIGSAQRGYGGKLTTYSRDRRVRDAEGLARASRRGPLADPPQHYPLMGIEEHECGRDGEWLTSHCAMACSTARLKLGGSMAGNR